MRILLTTLLMLCWTAVASAQVVVYQEDFSGYANGTTTSSKWDASNNRNCDDTGFWGVSGGAFEVTDWEGNPCGCVAAGRANGGNQNTWVTQNINIVNYACVEFSLEINGSGDFDSDSDTPLSSCTSMGHDQAIIEYSLSGGPWITIAYLHSDDAFPSGTYGESGLVGTSLRIRVRLGNQSVGETFTIDNVIVTGTVIPPPTITGPNTVCPGGEITLTANPGTFLDYEWSNGDLGQSITINAPGTYRVTVTDANGCRAVSNPKVVALAPTPNVTINTTGGQRSICAGSNLTLTAAGAGITSYRWSTGATSPSITINQADTYTVTVTNAQGCENETSIDIEENIRPSFTNPGNQAVCGAYTLPLITGNNLTGNEAYYTSPNGNGTSLLDGDEITSSRLIYIYGGEPGCTSQIQFQVSVTPQPVINNISDQTACDAYILPPITGDSLSAGRAYYTAPNRGGTALMPGDTIKTNQILYVFDGTATCNDQDTFSISIVPGLRVDDVPDTSVCALYILPAISGTNLTGNQAYYSGANGTGNRFNPGQSITASQQLYIFDQAAVCSSEQTFNVTITDGPQITPRGDTTVCSAYTLPAIEGADLSGNQAYYTGTNGTGTRLDIGQTITTSQRLYAYDTDGSCSSEDVFEVSIATTPTVNDVADVSSCGLYVLPAITGTNLSGNQAFYTQAGGTGTRYEIGDTIRSSVNLFIYDGATGCSDEESLSITVLQSPLLAPLADQASCAFYVLPTINGANLSGNQAYFSQSDGTGIQFAPGDTIRTNSTFFIFDDNGACTAEDTFTVTILTAPTLNPIPDDTACVVFVLPQLSGMNLSANAAYFTQPNGVGTAFASGDSIRTTTTLYAFDSNGTCSTQDTFLVTVSPNPTANIRTTNVSCNGGQNGALEVLVTGGAPPFRFDWNENNLDGQLSITGVGAGNYIVVVTDANNCRATASATLTEPAPLDMSCAVESSASGTTVSDGRASVLLTNGTAPFRLAWMGSVNGNTTVNAIDTVNISNLGAGSYEVRLTDANGCMATCNFAMSVQGCDISIDLAGTDATCANESNGAIVTTITDATLPIQYDWNIDSLDGIKDPTGLLPGVYVLNAIDSNNCIISDTIQIGTQFPLPDATITYSTIICDNECFSFELDLIGTPPFTLDYQLTTNIGDIFRTININSNQDTLEICPATLNTDDGNIIIQFLRLRDANCENELNRRDTLLVNPVARDTIEMTLCIGDSLVVNGNVYNEAVPRGEERLFGAATNGCDSFITVDLSFYPQAVTDLSPTICETDRIVVNGTVYNFANPSGREILVGASANGCDSIINITLQFFPLVVSDFTQTICETDSIVVNGTVYNFANPNGTEILIGAATNGCDSTVNINLQFFEPAVFDFTQTLCETDSIIVNGTVYNFANPSGREILVGASANGCDSIINITLQFLPPVISNFNPSICEGDSIVINGTVYNRANPSGTEMLVGAAENGCDSMVNISLQFLPPAVFDFTQTLCESDELVINGTLYNFTNPTGTETLPGASVNGCDSIIQVNLIFLPPAVNELNQTLCEGESIIINGTVYNQNNPSGRETLIGASENACDSIVNINLTFVQAVRVNLDTVLCPGETLVVNNVTYNENRLTGTETLVGAASNGCDSIVQINLRYRPAVTGAIEGDAAICAGDSTPLIFRLSGASSFDIRYSDGVNSFTLNDISDQYTLQVAPNQNTTYTITFLSVDGASCPAQLGSGATIQVSNLSADASVTSDYIGFGVSCFGAADGTILATGSNGLPPLSYRWSNGATSQQLQGLTAGAYTVTVTDAAGCVAMDSATLTVPAQIVVRSSTRSPGCANDKTGIIVIDSITGGAAPFEVSLNGSSYRAVSGFPVQLDQLAAGNYTVFVRDANDCETTVDAAILAPSEPEVDLGPDITIKLGDSIEIVALTNFEPTKIEWRPTDSLSNADSLRLLVHPLETTIYTVTVADTTGCLATDRITVFINRERGVFVPTAFTPDGDGVNDFFFINGGNDVVSIKEMRIFDRWGNLMFRRGAFLPNDPQLGWDGTFNGRKVNIGVYVYYAEIEFIDGATTIFQGDITIVR